MGKIPDYGIDAPIVVRNNIGGGVLAWVASIGLFFAFRHSHPDFASTIVRQGGVIGTIFLAVAAFMIWSSKIGKFRVRDRLLNSISWRGDEQVLDIGCGRGLALIGAARRLSSGHATGVDAWRSEDLSRNSDQAVIANVAAENVADKVTIKTGDARALAFADGSFDVVISMTVIHNIKNKAERRQAIGEAVRVLKEGGTMAIFDIFHAGSYVNWLREFGMGDVSKSGLIGLWMVPGRILVARKGANRR